MKHDKTAFFSIIQAENLNKITHYQQKPNKNGTIMSLHLLAHDPITIRQNNITIWADKRGYSVDRTDVFKKAKLPAQTDFDWLIVLGGSQHVWQKQEHPWLVAEKKFIAEALAKGKIILGICFGAQLLAEILGGRVFPNEKEEIGWYEVTISEEGKGSTFWFTVNLEKQSETLDKTIIIPEDIKGKRILIVDDNETNRLILKEQLRFWGCRYDEALNGIQALDKLHQAVKAKDLFDIALLDKQMPGMDGEILGILISVRPKTG